jgi:outer membrane lipoprotein-sorting protein
MRTIRQVAPSGEALLQRMDQADDTAIYVGIQTSRASYPGGLATSQQRIYHQGRSALRLDFLAGPGNLAGEEIVDNGTTFWHFSPSRNTVDIGSTRLRGDRARMRQLFALLDSGQVSARVSGQDIVAGRSCTVVELQMAGTSAPWRALWIDDATGIQLKIGQYRSDGSFLSSTALTEIEFVPSIPASTFIAPTVPPTATVNHIGPPRRLTLADVQARVHFTIRQPDYLPPGYAFDSAGTTAFFGSQMAILRYRSGPQTISIFEAPTSDPGSAGPVVNPKPDVSTVTIPGLRIIAVGASVDDRDAILGSIR